MWNTVPIQTQAILYIHRIYIEHVSKSELVKELQGEGKERKKDSE
jgi:hypothetical protein